MNCGGMANSELLTVPKSRVARLSPFGWASNGIGRGDDSALGGGVKYGTANYTWRSKGAREAALHARAKSAEVRLSVQF